MKALMDKTFKAFIFLKNIEATSIAFIFFQYFSFES